MLSFLASSVPSSAGASSAGAPPSSIQVSKLNEIFYLRLQVKYLSTSSLDFQ
jgi:hypothetical protein